MARRWRSAGCAEVDITRARTQRTRLTTRLAIAMLIATVVLPLYGAQSAGAGSLLHRWTFDDGTPRDSTGTAHGTLVGGARIADGRLIVGTGRYMRTSALPETIGSKTLIAWVSLAKLDQGGGSAVTIETISTDNALNSFDAIVFGERTRAQWMAGSEFYRRTPVDNGGAAETRARKAVMIAAVYSSSGKVSIYRNGALYASHRKGTLRTFGGGATDVLIGLRHTTCASSCHLAGSIDEARIYGGALTKAQIGALNRAHGG